MVEVAGLSLRAALSPARWLMPGATVGLAIRSEDIALAPQAERHAPELNAISVAVSEVRAEGWAGGSAAPGRWGSISCCLAGPLGPRPARR